MKIDDMTRKDFEAVPWRKDWCSPIKCHSMVILPSRKIHDSGYRCMDFVAIDKNGIPICRLSGCSDVIHIEGIGGYGYKWMERYGTCPQQIPCAAWSIDCLPKSGLLRIWPNSENNGMICGESLSSFSIYSKPKESK